MNPSTSAAVIPASSRQALMHSKWSEWVLASGRLPTLVSATPTMAYLPLMFDIKSSVAGLEQLEWWSNGVMHSKPDTPILPILQHSIFLLNSLYPMTPIFHISTSQRISSCQAFLSRPFGIAVAKIFSRQDAKQSFTKSEARNKPKEFNANCEIRNELVWNFVLF